MLLDYFKKQPVKYPINPRFRAYGKARLEIARRAKTDEEWDTLWKKPANAFPFEWGHYWKQCVEYRVDDFAAEVGFLVDFLGLPVNAIDPEYAMFTSPDEAFYIAVTPATAQRPATPSDAIRLQFMVSDVLKTAEELKRRGIAFEQWPQACEPGSQLYIGYFRTPHGICMDLWGTVETAPVEDAAPPAAQIETLQRTLAQEFQEEQQLEAELIEEQQAPAWSTFPVEEALEESLQPITKSQTSLAETLFDGYGLGLGEDETAATPEDEADVLNFGSGWNTEAAGASAAHGSVEEPDFEAEDDGDEDISDENISDVDISDADIVYEDIPDFFEGEEPL